MTPDDIVAYIKRASAPVSKRELARAFKLKGGARIALKQILKSLEDEGTLIKQSGHYLIPDTLPSVGTIEVSEHTVDGDLLGHPEKWNSEIQGPAPRIEIMPAKKGHPDLKPGDRALVRFVRINEEHYEAHIIRQLNAEKSAGIPGIVKIRKKDAFLKPVNKKSKHDFEIPSEHLNGAQDGDIVLARIQKNRVRSRYKTAEVLKILGKKESSGAISLISLYESGLQEQFPESVLQKSENFKVPSLKNREDLRGIPLVTIDGEDAKDFDDAVFAESEKDGFHLIVAIADVSYYVRNGTALDREAQRRGNSTYFPDRVVPMLPEFLSNDLCSLRPHEDRACLAAHLWIDQAGQLKKYKFVRALMRSKERLTYEQVQHIYDLERNHKIFPILKPLYDVYEILNQARQKRGALELDLPERRIVLNEKGQVENIKERTRLDSHRLIEEFMVLANVAAARALEDKKALCVYRVHEPPGLDKLESAREFVSSFGLSLPKGQVPKPSQLNQVLLKARQLPYSHLISQVILRTQSQAHYSPKNKGHFGLALPKYAHFTSPIRRYADLLVHRSLVKAYGLGEGGLDDQESSQLAGICESISGTERTSAEAERNAMDRFTAMFLSERIGAEFEGRITGVTRFGLFVELEDSGADGIVPMRSLPDDFYIHDEHAHALIGRRHGRVYRLGAPVTVKLKEADGLTGSTVLQLVGHNKGADIPGMPLRKKKKKSRKSRRHRKS